MAAAWTAGHPGPGQRSAQWEALIHSGTPSNPPLPSTSYVLQKLSFYVLVGALGIHVFLLVSHVPAPSCWLVEHSRVAQLAVIGVQLGNFAEHQNLKLRGIAQRCSSSVKS